nr:MAG TPA: hypothetical protein [Caudoviricetes sp.]
MILEDLNRGLLFLSVYQKKNDIILSLCTK